MRQVLKLCTFFHWLLYYTRIAWVMYMGAKYHAKEFIIIGWQDNDLPVFAKTLNVYVKSQEVFFKVQKFTTLGIVRHFHSFVIQKTDQVEYFKGFSEYLPCSAISQNELLYVTLRSHVENYN